MTSKTRHQANVEKLSNEIFGATSVAPTSKPPFADMGDFKIPTFTKDTSAFQKMDLRAIICDTQSMKSDEVVEFVDYVGEPLDINDPNIIWD